MTLEQAIEITREHIRIGYGMIEEGFADVETYQIPQALEMVLNELESRAKVVNGDQQTNEYSIYDSLINSPKHYIFGGIETLDYIRAKLSQDEIKGYYKGNIIKYLSRATQKGTEAQDYEKALYYLNKLVNLVDPLYEGE